MLGTGPRSYWRLDESSGTTAASSALASVGTDNGTYSSTVSLGQPGPLAGSAATSTGFNGGAWVSLPQTTADSAGYQSVSLWFKTSTAGGVLLGSARDPITIGNATTGAYTPELYIGTDGDLRGEFWTGSAAPVTTSTAVDNGQWHLAVLTGAGSTQSLYLDGTLVGTISAAIGNTGLLQDSIGAGFAGGNWPSIPSADSGQFGTRWGVTGDISDAAAWDRPLTPAEVTAMYQAGTTATPLITKITRPTGSVSAQPSYSPVTGAVTSLTDSNGGTWTVAAPKVSGSSNDYVASVLGQDPADYWRLNDDNSQLVPNQVNADQAFYSQGITHIQPSAFPDSFSSGFTASSDTFMLMQSVELDQGGNGTVSLWFKTTTTGGVLVGASTDTPNHTAGQTTTSGFVPVLYVGADGKLLGQFYTGSTANTIESAGAVDDGNWHNVVLAAGSNETLYLDGKAIGSTASGEGAVSVQANNSYIGTGFLGGSWPDIPSADKVSGQGTVAYFTGDLSDVAVYPSQLSAQAVGGEWSAYQASIASQSPTATIKITDPGGNTETYQEDPLNSSRLTSMTDGLGNTTSYGYDVNGFLDETIDPDGNVTFTGHDVRGNVTSKSSCQSQTQQNILLGLCTTEYLTYFPDDTSATLTKDPRNDLPLTERGPGSASATDDTFLTTFTYNSLGERTSETGPDVPGAEDGQTISDTYTTSTTEAFDSSGNQSGTTPPGLVASETASGGAVTSYTYYSDGDVNKVTNPDGETTAYTYDGVGRVLSKTVTSTSFPHGLTTTYAYDALGEPVTETDPLVTDTVTGDPHTPQTTTVYDADGDVTSQTVADTTGGDASRTVTSTYNSDDQLTSTTDPAGNKTSYTYDAFGNLASQTDPAGNVTDYAYNPNGQLLTTTLENFTGIPSGSQQAAPLTQSTQTYDPAGRLASVTDSMSNTTAYTYTDNGLLATETRCTQFSAAAGCGGDTFVQQQNTYDTSGNLEQQVTNNGQTTTGYEVDAIGRVDATDLDPLNLGRTTSYTFNAASQVTNQTITDASGSTVESDSYTYDPMGNMTSQVQADGSASLTTSWALDSRGLPTSMTDPNGNVTDYQYDAAGQLAQTTLPITTATFYNITTHEPVQQSEAPVTSTGYNTFGEQVETEDADGNIYTTARDADGNAVSTTAPSYTPPDGSGTIAGAQATQTYNTLGEMVTQTDPLGNKTTLGYDQLGDLTSQTAPDGGVTSYGYDTNGDQTSVTDPVGAVTDATFDFMGRKVTSTQVEQIPSPASYTTTYSYGGSTTSTPWLVSQTTPDGVTTAYTHDAAGEQTSVTDGAGNPTTYAFDGDGRPTTTTNPDDTTTTSVYDEACRMTSQADFNASGTQLRSESFAYDNDGNQLSATDYRGNTSKFTYSPDSQVTGEVQPVTATSSITTAFGYDAGGQPDRVHRRQRQPVVHHLQHDGPARIAGRAADHGRPDGRGAHHLLRRRRQPRRGAGAGRGHRH